MCALCTMAENPTVLVLYSNLLSIAGCARTYQCYSDPPRKHLARYDPVEMPILGKISAKALRHLLVMMNTTRSKDCKLLRRLWAMLHKS